ncbi:MAG TPA: NADH-quinone oxidoreductase subunit NuoK [Anaerolineae bacterium]|nr:NADH-quinone oxidoreductase subunit NuoK [Anaerolineae bacterium]HPL27952.1 NADH-quinone oxidoreductase subunit NuoK [Anaerolineae bacterium]
MIPLTWYLVLAAALFCIGLYGVLARRNAIGLLMGIELMLNAANINLLAFERYVAPNSLVGQAFVVFNITVAAAEAAVGLALIIAIYRSRDTVAVEDIDLLRG